MKRIAYNTVLCVKCKFFVSRRINPEKSYNYASLEDYQITSPENLANKTLTEASAEVSVHLKYREK